MIYRRLCGTLAAMTLLLASACSFYSEVPPEPQTIGESYRVTPQSTWSSYKKVDHTLWTIDGQALEALDFYAGIEDGEPLVAKAPDSGKPLKDVPLYKAGMRAGDVADVVAATLEKLNQGEAAVENLRPARFGSLPGFRFEVAYTAPNGLKMRSDCLGAVNSDGTLHLIVYSGSEEHYYDAHHDKVEALFQSVEVI